MAARADIHLDITDRGTSFELCAAGTADHRFLVRRMNPLFHALPFLPPLLAGGLSDPDCTSPSHPPAPGAFFTLPPRACQDRLLTRGTRPFPKRARLVSRSSSG